MAKRSTVPLFSNAYVDDARVVTSMGGSEVSPAAVGLRQHDVDAIWNAVELCYRTGLYPAIALCIRRRGEVLIDRAIGYARGAAPTDPKNALRELATPSTLYNLFSGAKCVTAMLVHGLQERGLLDVEAPVADYVPEFARHRKQTITIRDVLSHQAGIANTPTEVLDIERLGDPEFIRQVVCDLKPNAKPGHSAAYHAVTSGFVLQLVIEAVTGDSIREVLRWMIRAPMGMKDFDYGVSEADLPRVALDAFTGARPMWPAGAMIEESIGLPMEELVSLGNDPRFRTGVVPSANILCTPDEACRFFEMLLNGGKYDGVRVFEQRTVERAVAPVRSPWFDRTLMLPMTYSMGFMLGRPTYGFFGPRCERAFGHLGFSNTLAWADPERDISVCLMTTGKPLLSVRLVAWLNIMRVIGTRIARDRA